MNSPLPTVLVVISSTVAGFCFNSPWVAMAYAIAMVWFTGVLFPLPPESTE